MRWIDAPATPAAQLSGFHPLIAGILTRRGMETPETARAFLDPESYIPAPATELPGCHAAAERVARAVRTREPMCVWGDFDVDGQTSTTVLYTALLTMGADVTYHIPVRARESHGVNVENLARIIEQGVTLVLTCDTGIGAHEAIEYARARGVDVVITDHHDLPERLPEAAAIINPKLLPPDHALATLPGVGVAYKFLEVLAPAFNFDPRPLLDLVALGLVADLAILRKDCRYLLQKGLAQLRSTERIGLQAMMELAELQPANLTEEHIGFMLGPRLNALGRLGDANPAVELLSTRDPARARVLAVQLEALNAQRKLLCDQVSRAAEDQLRRDPALLSAPILILHHPAWPGGVVGIAASRLVERYHKPAILLCGGEDGLVRGSARSVEGLHITEAITAQKDLLYGFGGHPMAAGLAMPTNALTAFRRRMAKTVEKMLGLSALGEPELTIDAWLTLEAANLDLAGHLERLAPFGPGNEKPILATRNLSLRSSSEIGKNREHRKLLVEDETGITQQVLWWNGGIEEVPEGKFDLAYTLRASDWRGSKQAQLEFVHLRVVEQEVIEVKQANLKFLDYRAEKNKEEALSNFRLQQSTAVWIEGEDKKRLGGLDRYHLPECDTLVIWSTPPSPEVFHGAMSHTKPRNVVLFAVNPAVDTVQAFLERLAGLVKFALNKKGGLTSLAELSAACAQGETATRLGLEWLSKRGQVQVEIDSNGAVWVKRPDNREVNPGDADEVQSHLENILREVYAYRAYFASKDIQQF